MDFYLIPQKGERLHLPVNPQGFKVNRRGIVDTVNIRNLGEVDLWDGLGRTVVTFDSFFPRHWDTYCQYTDIEPPNVLFKRLEGMWMAGEPVRLLITESPVNVMVIITENPYEDRGGEPGDIYYSLTMRQWVDISVKKKEDDTKASVKGENTPRSRQDTKAVPKIYTVKSGDTLTSIARIQFGDSSKVDAIYNLNKSVIGPNKNIIRPGQRLVMPT